MKHRVAEEFKFVLTFVGIIWAVFVLDFVLPGELNRFGLVPRTVTGLPGVLTMPFLHSGWDHLVGNTVPLIVLLCLLAGSSANTYRIVPQLILFGGALLWVLGRSQTIHVGASGLIYGLITFLIVSGFREGRIAALAVAIVVGILYGGTLLSGVLPFTTGTHISWDGHLAGAIAGVLVARSAVPSKSPAV